MERLFPFVLTDSGSSSKCLFLRFLPLLEVSVIAAICLFLFEFFKCMFRVFNCFRVELGVGATMSLRFDWSILGRVSQAGRRIVQIVLFAVLK